MSYPELRIDVQYEIKNQKKRSETYAAYVRKISEYREQKGEQTKKQEEKKNG